VEHINIYKTHIRGIVPKEKMSSYPTILLFSAWAAHLDGDTGNMFSYMDMLQSLLPFWISKNSRIAKLAAMHIYLDPRMKIETVVNSPLMKAFSAVAFQQVNSSSITQNFPYFHRSHRDYSEIALDIDKKMKELQKAIGNFLGEDYNAMDECVRAGLLMERGELAAAEDHAAKAVALPKNELVAEMEFCSMMIMADILYKRQKFDAAEKMRSSIQVMLETGERAYLKTNFDAYICRLKILSGNVEAAHEWLKIYDIFTITRLAFFLTYRDFTTAIAYLVTGKYDVAILLLLKMKKLFEDYDRPLDIIETHILLSIAHWNDGEQKRALNSLEAAVDAAYKYGFISVFIFSGMDISGMLRQLHHNARTNKDEDKGLVRFIKALLDNIQQEQQREKPVVTAALFKPVKKLPTQQKKIANGLVRGMTNPEMAKEYGKALSTIKRHRQLLFQKWGVSNAKEAVLYIKQNNIDIDPD